MIHWIDYFVIFLFIFGFSVYGILQSRKNQSSRDYFLGDRNLPWPIAMFSVVATETSVLTFISVPGLAYRDNWYFLQLALGYIIGRVLVSLILLPQYFSTGIISIYEVLGKKFGKNIQKIASAVFLVTRVLADGIRFLATAVVVQVITGWSLPASVLMIGIVTLGYTLSGGIRTIVWIDSIQFVLYLFGGVLTILFCLNHLDQSFASILSSLTSEGKLEIFNWRGNLFFDSSFFISALIGGALLSLASHGVDYMMVQRVLGTNSLDSAKKAMIGSGIFVFFQFTVFLMAGSLIFVMMDGVEIAKDREFTSFIVNYLPVGLKGVLLAGVLSAAMSTLSSSINALASSTINDWMGGSSSLKLSRFISLAWATILIGIALLFDESDSAIVIVGLQIASFTYGGLLGLFLLSKLKHNFHQVSLITGLVTSLLIVFYLKQVGIAWTWFILLSVFINILTVYIVDELRKRLNIKRKLS
ncbi:MAG: sodium:solute symporter [Candidatus Marinimicrobia bacterium]|nr:sodium:solute symporter [Candidatus Neomarinimicrobiota bacterium]|tara:strand:- start:3173 stop:4588 length:1416 start_codon:yes stop_codon:yes gene_type:complete